MPPVTTKTLNPLPFEHLEPKRFEDLARQLAYDFKPWRQLEATGRTGSDDGFDARGFEIVQANSLATIDSDEYATDEGATDRLWLIQCKRERSIGPTKMRAHLEAIPIESRTHLYGLIFVAACDFSKATRDTLRAWCAVQRIAECHIWGKAELEDMLYQPKNDNLLFAYFGISIQIRRQKAAANIRRTITIKRRIARITEESNAGIPVLLRDINDERYPYIDYNYTLSSSKSLWIPVNTLGVGVFGLRVIVREFWAYYDYESGQWDIASKINFSIPPAHENPWYDLQVELDREDESRKIVDFWTMLPRCNQYFMRIVSSIGYNDIIEIDDIKDNLIEIPTVFTQFINGSPPYLPNERITFRSSGRFVQESIFEPQNYVRVFPDTLRDIAWENQFFEKYGVLRPSAFLSVVLTEPEWKVKLRENIDNTDSDQ